MIVGVNEIAKFMGVNMTTVYQWIRDGCPVHEKGTRGKNSHKLDTREVTEWRLQKEREGGEARGGLLSKQEAQRRKLNAEAEKAELEVAKQKGLVVDLNELQTELENKFAEFRAVVRKIPERCVLRLVGEMDERKIKTIILEEIDAALELLADDR